MTVSRARIRLHEKQGGKCHYCGVAMILTNAPHPGAVTVDHIIPKSIGGTRDPDNIVGACLTCNGARGAEPYEEFKQRVLRDGRPHSVPLDQSIRKTEQKRLARAVKAAVAERPGSWSAPKLGPTRPYLADVGKHPIMADALVAAGIADPIEENS